MNYVRVLAVACLFASASARAEPLTVDHALPGYVCMMLRLTNEQMRQGDALPPVLAAPQADAATLGHASSLVAAKAPARIVNGYAEVLHLDGRPGWVDSRILKPYRNLNNPRATCAPVAMNNGMVGFR